MPRPFFASTPLYLITFYLAFAIWAIPELLGSFFQRSGRYNLRKDRGSNLILFATLCLGLFVAFFLAFRLPAADFHSLAPVFFGLGIILILVGVALRWYAIRTLGRFFTRDVATQTGQAVIQTGPYRLIRHPSYAGSLITLLGVGLALTNWAGLLALLLITGLGFLYRMTIEERALAETLGDPYREYMRRTRRLIPYIW